MRNIITIDGPSGTGKGTLCAMLANYLGWHQLDSGVIYRVLAWAVMCLKLDLSEIPELVKTALTLDFSMEAMGSVFWQGEDVTLHIRTEACGQMASKISAIEVIRHALLERQRTFYKPPGLVTDGRDMGTVIFPDAAIKFFLTASAEERARRRFAQLKKQGSCVTFAQVVSELAARDARDTSRAFSPLKPADDAVLIDTTHLPVAKVFDLMLKVINRHEIETGEGEH